MRVFTSVAGAVALWGVLAWGGAASAQSVDRLGSQPQQMLYVMVKVADLEKAKAFYEGVVGLKEIPGRQGSAGRLRLSFSDGYGDTFLVLTQLKSATTPSASEEHLGQLTFKVADLKAVVARARQAGARFLFEPQPPRHEATMRATIEEAVISDPDGNHVELVQVSPD